LRGVADCCVQAVHSTAVADQLLSGGNLRLLYLRATGYRNLTGESAPELSWVREFSQKMCLLGAENSKSRFAGRCTIRTRGQDHQDARVGPGGTPQCWRSGVPRRLHNWCTHPADLLSGRAQGDLRAQRLPVAQGRLGGWLLRA